MSLPSPCPPRRRPFLRMPNSQGPRRFPICHVPVGPAYSTLRFPPSTTCHATGKRNWIWYSVIIRAEATSVGSGQSHTVYLSQASIAIYLDSHMCMCTPAINIFCIGLDSRTGKGRRIGRRRIQVLLIFRGGKSHKICARHIASSPRHVIGDCSIVVCWKVGQYFLIFLTTCQWGLSSLCLPRWILLRASERHIVCTLETMCAECVKNLRAKIEVEITPGSTLDPAQDHPPFLVGARRSCVCRRGKFQVEVSRKTKEEKAAPSLPTITYPTNNQAPPSCSRSEVSFYGLALFYYYLQLLLVRLP